MMTIQYVVMWKEKKKDKLVKEMQRNCEFQLVPELQQMYRTSVRGS